MRGWVVGAVGLVGMLSIGCEPSSEHEPSETAGRQAPGRGGPGGTSLADRDDGGAGDVASPAHGNAAPPAGIAPCGELDLRATLSLAAGPPGQKYQRCDTLGPEADWHVTLSSDASRLAARTSAGTVRLLGTDPWRGIAQLASPLGRMDAVAFSPDGSTLATLSAEMGQVTLWRATDGVRMRTFAARPASTLDAATSALAFSSDGTQVAASLGVVIDLTRGTITDWRTGTSVSVLLAANPQNLEAGLAVSALRFVAGDSRLLVRSDYRIGNSPPSTRLELRDPRSGSGAVLFDMYQRALQGFAVSTDAALVAFGATREAVLTGVAPGVHLVSAADGTEIAASAALLGTVLGFSVAGDVLYVLDGSILRIVDVPTLRELRQLPWHLTFVAISPAGELVGTTGSATEWRSPASGSTVRAVPFALTEIAWSADARHAAGTGDPGALFHLWSESGGTGDLCAPPSGGYPAPALSALGVVLGDGQLLTTGSISISRQPVLHTHSADWTALFVRAHPGGELLRVFGATAAPRDIAVALPAGDQLFTIEGQSVAVWCR